MAAVATGLPVCTGKLLVWVACCRLVGQLAPKTAALLCWLCRGWD